MNKKSNSSNYKVGGIVPLDNPIYVKRKADDELYNSLKEGEFCYVLNSRQMGKSSLLIRTMRRLESEGFACANIDVSGDIGTDLDNPKQWYDTFFDIIVDRFNLDFPEWWSDCQSLSSLRRFSKFIENILLQEVQQDIIIFVDEVDSVLGLRFKIDDFFKFIRACYNKRSSKPEYKRLTFALFGVATPSDLIQDKKVTPFNIGKAIELNGFCFDEAQPLTQDLVAKVQNPQKVLKTILDWTGGQPFLTQKLCQLVSTSSVSPNSNEVFWLNQLIRSNIIEDWESHDNPEHLRTIHNRILANKQSALYLLSLYKRILSEEKIKADDSLKQIELRLSGLVVKKTGKLNVYNPIYQAVFDQHWVDSSVEYLRSIDEEPEYLYEAKLIIIGDSGVGKTTLARKIGNPSYQINKDEKSTEGIDLTKWSFPIDNEREFKVNIWDLSGKEIYHATHQFFLTRQSLYILVIDARKEYTNLLYWLNIVELLSNNSPILIIKNEKQSRRIEIDNRRLRGLFINLKDTLATNLATNQELDKIITQIKNHITSLPQIGTALPKTWIKVRKILENNEQNYISLGEYLTLCQDNGISNRQDKLQLSTYLHDLGMCLHFQDKEDSLLFKIIILNPEWVANAIYQVLDNKQVINNLGRFTINDLNNIWSDLLYTFKKAELLELMMRFRICYRISESNDNYIAPLLLTETKPQYNWDEIDNLILHYTYEFMPKGIISQFIVAMHQYIDQQQHVWRNGVVIHKDDTSAEVVEYYNKREIKIRVAGKLKRDLMNQVTYELDQINASFNSLIYEKLVPCNCQTCSTNSNPHFYNFKIITKMIHNRKLTIQCPISYQMVNVLSLIDDLIVRQNNLEIKPKQHQTLKIIKIFLSSSSELLNDRSEFEIFINRKNKEYIKQGVFLELVLWEDFIDAMSATRLQDEYNKVVTDCDIFVSLFHTKVGKYTEEEFLKALQTFKYRNRPLIYTYFKDAKININQISPNILNLLNFKEKLRDLGHFSNNYFDINDLKYKFSEQLIKIIPMLAES